MNMNLSPIALQDRLVGPGQPPLIVAELSGNHQGCLDTALAVVDAVADAGAHALKLQTYTADTMTLNVDRPEFRIDNPHSPWHGQHLYDLYQQAATPWAWHEAIFQRCAERGMLGFSSPFDATAVDFLRTLDPPCYKIASFENTDIPLIQRVAATGKPLILSTGMATLAELHTAVTAARAAGCRELILLKCTSAYPAPVAEANLATLTDLQQQFACPVGLSDHTLGIEVAAAAVALGACLIEKHVTLSRAAGGVDAGFSLEPSELAELVAVTTQVQQAIGTVRYGPTPRETPGLLHRRSIYVVSAMRAGDELTPATVRVIRPAHGLPPSDYPAILGRRVRIDLPRGTPLQWSHIE
jgi:N-acetylneuraminate synthase